MSDVSDIFCTNESCENYGKNTFNGCKTRFTLCDKETYSQILDLRGELEQVKKENKELREYKSMYEGLCK